MSKFLGEFEEIWVNDIDNFIIVGDNVIYMGGGNFSDLVIGSVYKVLSKRRLKYCNIYRDYEEVWVDDIDDGVIRVGDSVMIMEYHSVKVFDFNDAVVFANFYFGDCVFKVVDCSDIFNGVRICPIGYSVYDFVKDYWYDINYLVKV